MIFSFLLRRLFLLLLFAVVSNTTNYANAQCPGGRPPNKNGSCGEPEQESKKPAPPAPKPVPPQQQRKNNPTSVKKRGNSVSANNSCSLNVRVTRSGGVPLADVNVTLDDASKSSGVTDAKGTYKFTNLPCKRKYKVVPTRSGFTFNIASVTIQNLPKNGSATFTASVLDLARKADAPCNSPPTPLPKIQLDVPVTGKLGPQSSWCEESIKGYFHSYQLDGAFGGDVIQYDLRSEQSADLLLQVVDQAGIPVEIDSDSEADDPGTARQLILPKAGEYILRVIDKSNKSIDYSLSLTRKGLSDEGYRGQLERAYAAVAEPDRPTFYSSLHQHLERIKPFVDAKASEVKINEATIILEKLRELVPNKSEALSMLAAIYLYYRKDLDTARELMLKALELGGEARFRVSFGERIDKDQRRVTDGKYSCWLIIRKGKILCEPFIRPNDGEVFNSNPQWLAKKPIDIPNYYFGLTIYGGGKKANKNDKKDGDMFEIDTYYFVPLSSLDLNAKFPLTEVQTMKSLIRDYVEKR
jgi:tetratricopeptide (TPR) repeat protein